ncbi:hypothetical protein PV325_011689 [Microctonus aethiopoides]|nr:hypothetical protein PV325_011689 [Microctonus aethiopoides]
MGSYETPEVDGRYGVRDPAKVLHLSLSKHKIRQSCARSKEHQTSPEICLAAPGRQISDSARKDQLHVLGTQIITKGPLRIFVEIFLTQIQHDNNVEMTLYSYNSIQLLWCVKHSEKIEKHVGSMGIGRFQLIRHMTRNKEQKSYEFIRKPIGEIKGPLLARF